MKFKRECDYCGIDRGGWHGCYYQLLWLIESYIDKHIVIDPNELAAQIADAGYASSKEDTDADV
jgi:hypothetical protein